MFCGLRHGADWRFVIWDSFTGSPGPGTYDNETRHRAEAAGAQHVMEMFRRTLPDGLFARASTDSPTDSLKSLPSQRASAPLAGKAQHPGAIRKHTATFRAPWS